MTEFEDFKPFFEAMIAKMKTHDHDRGDSWKEDGWYDEHEIYHDMDHWLLYLMRQEYIEYSKSKDPSELLDIANFAAMIYMRNCSESRQ